MRNRIVAGIGLWCALFAFAAAAADTRPNPFYFVDKTGAVRNAVSTSRAVRITGIDAPAPISVSGGSYSIGCGSSFVTAAGSIGNGQTVCVRNTASSANYTAVDTTLTIGGVADTYTTVTKTASASKTAAQIVGTGNGRLLMLDPALAQSPGNPITADIGIPLNDRGGGETLVAADISGSVASNIRYARVAYIKNGRVFVANPTIGQNNTALQVSSVTDACEIDGRQDLANPDNSWLSIQRRGSDGDCYTGDDIVTMVRVTARATDPGISPFVLSEVQAIPDASGGISGFLTIEDNQPFKLMRRDANFANPVALLNLASTADQQIGLIPNLQFLALLPQGRSDAQLFRYDNRTGALSAALYTFVGDSELALADGTYDGSNLYFADGDRLLRTPLNATSATQTRVVTTAAAGRRIERIAASTFSRTRLVFEAFDNQQNGGVFSVLKTANNGTATTLRASGNGVAANLVVLAQGNVYVNVQNFDAGSVSALRIGDDGSGAVTAPNAFWAGGLTSTSLDLNATSTNGNLDATAIVLARKTGSNAALQVVDPATGAVGITLGTLHNLPSFVSAFTGGFGRYAALTALARRADDFEDADVYVFDSQTANSLRAVSALLKQDDYVVGN